VKYMILLSQKDQWVTEASNYAEAVTKAIAKANELSAEGDKWGVVEKWDVDGVVAMPDMETT